MPAYEPALNANSRQFRLRSLLLADLNIQPDAGQRAEHGEGQPQPTGWKLR